MIERGDTRGAYRLCELDRIPDGGTRGFQIQLGGHSLDLFLVRRGARAFAYRNSCPHTGGPLDWVPDQFLDIDGRWIQCATHAALFQIESGLCIAGPCAGDRLSPVTIRLIEGVVWVVCEPSGVGAPAG